MKNYAPVVLFVYNRPTHTRLTVEALKRNELAKESDLFIYSDGPHNSQTAEKVDEVRDYIKNIDGFKHLTIIKRETNFGLAANIIDGVTKVINQYDNVIVLEDDLLSSPYFLTFMNKALVFYKNETRLWHITGYNCPICPDGLDDTFVWRMMYCWGWGTWADRWRHYRKNTDQLIKDFTKQDIDRFNLDGVANVWNHVLGNQSGVINTWAIYWYATIFNHGGLCLNPTMSYIKNIGLDGSGVHRENILTSGDQSLNSKSIVRFTTDLKESQAVLERIKYYYLSLRKPIYVRATNKVWRYLFSKNLIQ